MISARPSIAVLATLSLSLAFSVVGANAATDPGAACGLAKQKAAVKKLGAKAKCHAKAVKKGEPVDAACLTSAETKFDEAFTKAESKGGCITTADAASAEAMVDTWLDEMLEELPTSKRIVFVSSQTHDANFGGLAGADLFCQGLATTAGLPGTYFAWLSTSTVDAVDRISASPGAFTLVDGTVLATSLADLTDGILNAPIVFDENGAAPAFPRVWTGTAPDGTACFQGSGGNCNMTSPGNDGLDRSACADWTSTAGGSEATTGYDAADGNWTLEGDRACSDQHRVYCVQQ